MFPDYINTSRIKSSNNFINHSCWNRNGHICYCEDRMESGERGLAGEVRKIPGRDSVDTGRTCDYFELTLLWIFGSSLALKSGIALYYHWFENTFLPSLISKKANERKKLLLRSLTDLLHQNLQATSKTTNLQQKSYVLLVIKISFHTRVNDMSRAYNKFT